MKIKYMLLENFLGIYAGTGKTKIEIDFSKNKNKLIVFNGGNGKGKTVLLSLLHPLRGTFDDRKNIVMKDKTGHSICILDYNGVEYKTEHFYGKKNKSFISKDGVELNENGNIRSFEEIAKEELGLDGEYFKVGKIGSNVSNFIDLKTAERKKYINQFIPNIDDYLEAYDTVKDKYTAMNTEVKVIKGNIEKYSNLRDLSEIEKDLEDYKQYKKDSEKRLAELNLKLKENENKINNFINELKDLIKTSPEIISFINDYTDYSSLDEINDLDPLLVILDDSELKYSTEYNEKIDLIDITKDKMKIKSIPDSKLEDYIKKQVEKIVSDISKIETENNHINETITNLKNEIINIENSVTTLEAKLNKDFLKLTPEEIESYQVKLKNYVEQIDLLNKTNKKLLKENKDNEFFKYHLNFDFDKSSINVYSKCYEDFIDLIVKMKSKYNEDDIQEFISNHPDNTIYSYHQEKIKEFNTIQNTINEKNKRLNQLLNKESICNENLSNRPKTCKDDSCSFINMSVKFNKEEKPELDALQKELDSNKLENQLNDIQKEIEKLEIFEDLLKDEKFLIDFLKNGLNNIIELSNDSIILEYIKNEGVFNINPSLFPETIGIYNFKKYILNKVEITDLTRYKESLESDINNYNLTREAYETISTELNEKKSLIKENLNKVSELENSKIEYEDFLKKAKFKKSLYEKLSETIIEKNKVEKIYNSIKDVYNIAKDKITRYKADLNNIEVENDNIYNSLDNINKSITEIDRKIIDTNSNIVVIKENMKRLSELEDDYNDLVEVKNALDPKKGIPIIFINNYLISISQNANKLLDIAYNNQFKIKFKVTASDFLVEVYKGDGTFLEDIKLASQGETSLTNISLSLAMLETMMKKYNILYLDEIDATLSNENRRIFIELLERQIESLDIEQCFIITHNNEFYNKNVDLILFDGHDCDLNDKDFMQGKNVIADLS